MNDELTDEQADMDIISMLSNPAVGLTIEDAIIINAQVNRVFQMVKLLQLKVRMTTGQRLNPAWVQHVIMGALHDYLPTSYAKKVIH